jgi:MEMO1 family protein
MIRVRFMETIDMSDRSLPGPTWPAFARQVIDLALRRQGAARPDLPADAKRKHGGVFVTLHKFGRLRGCMGLLDSAEPLPEAIRQAAHSAALHDPRFPPVALGELPDITIDVSILSQAWPMRSIAELELGVHGIIVQKGRQRGLFLPQVAPEHGLDKEHFLSRCCSEKAGLAPDDWKKPGVEVLLFTAEVLRESAKK